MLMRIPISLTDSEGHASLVHLLSIKRGIDLRQARVTICGLILNKIQ